jgi:hypothetical protein
VAQCVHRPGAGMGAQDGSAGDAYGAAPLHLSASHLSFALEVPVITAKSRSAAPTVPSAGRGSNYLFTCGALFGRDPHPPAVRF